MNCLHCRAEVNVFDTTCHACGKALRSFDLGSDDLTGGAWFEQTIGSIERDISLATKGLMAGLDGIDSLADSVNNELAKELLQAEQSLFGSHDEPRKAGSKGGSVFPAPEISWKLSTLAKPPEGSGLLKTSLVDRETYRAEIHQIGQFVFHSSHVQANPLYKQRAESTTLLCLSEQDEVNAFATDHRHPGISVDPPFIVLFGGLSRAARFAALELGLDQTLKTRDSRVRLHGAIQALGRKIMADSGTFSDEAAEALYEEFGGTQRIAENSEAVRKGRSFSAAMNMSVIAHELGHIALGHTLGARTSYEISRNQEREADSFASSVASASPFTDYIVAGSIFWWIIMTWVEAAAGRGKETTHPHARERLLDFIRANRDQAMALGIDGETVKGFVG